MTRWRELSRACRGGVLFCSLVALALLGSLMGLVWIALPAALGALGVAAVVAGADSREAGDWRDTGSW